MILLWSFVIGGAICSIGQIVIDYTNIKPARLLIIYVCAGIVFTALGLYEPLVKFAGAGATIPLSGFGYSLAKGTIKAVSEQGLIGVLSGGLTATAAGVSAAILFGYLFSLIFNAKEK